MCHVRVHQMFLTIRGLPSEGSALIVNNISGLDPDPKSDIDIDAIF